MKKISECKKCGADIIWMVTNKGKWMPVDAETLADHGADVFDASQGMISHFATCPNADEFRKEK